MMPHFPVNPVLSVRTLDVTYTLSDGRSMQAVDQASFDIAKGETLALVGESGCGKSSVARAVMRLVPVSGGAVLLEDEDLATMSRRQLNTVRRRFQMIFQDPISSLNPRRRIREILLAPLRVNGLYRRQDSEHRMRQALEQVGLDPDSVLERYPHEFSGGQCQRISIARALILEPVLLVCDEPVSALDVSVRAQILNVLNELRSRLSLSMLFISHDLAVVRNVADRVAVMYLGRICEIGPAEKVLLNSAHPYTAALLSAVPHADPDSLPRRIALTGEMPSHLDLPTGCRFRTRCPSAKEVCATAQPALNDVGDGQLVACHFPFSISAKAFRPDPSSVLQESSA